VWIPVLWTAFIPAVTNRTSNHTQLYIDPEECIDCGACVPECPVEAIFPEAEVPEKWSDYVGINYKWFEDKE